MSNVLRTSAFLFAVCISQGLRAEHNSEFFDFDLRRGPFFPETYSSTSGGNVYLGPYRSERVRLYLMDVLPALNSQTGLSDQTDRMVSLNFDLVFPILSLPGINDQFTIHANDELVFQQSFFQLGAFVSRRNVQTDFLLRYQPIFDPNTQSFMPFDLILDFSRTGSSKTWGLDNVAIDWGRPVPEPSAAVLTSLSLTVVACFRRKRRKILAA